MKIKNNELLIGAISIIVILFLSNYLNKNVTERNGRNGMNGKKDLGNFPVPQSSSITQRLSNGIKNIPNFFFPKVDDSPKQIIRNKGGNIKPIYAEKEYVKEDILSANPIGSTEFSFVGSDPEKAWIIETVFNEFTNGITQEEIRKQLAKKGAIVSKNNLSKVLKRKQKKDN